MARYFAYLEGVEGGPWMAHVLDLPGCFVRADRRDTALVRLAQSVRDCMSWLRRHGETVPPEGEPIQIELAEEHTGIGPFASGDAAALFRPEGLSIDPEGMEVLFRLLEHSRADLLALVRDLSDHVLDWRPDLHSRSVRRILRHVGNAEEWYVSRLVLPENLPAEWNTDEELPIFDFLDMERRTAVECLRRLDERGRSKIFFSDCWTEHPEEAWSARKVLRRFLEHEREHLVEIRRILALQRAHLLARLAAARAELCSHLLGLDERALCEVILHGDWTLQDALAHLAGWDLWVLPMQQRLLAGGPPDLETVRDLNAYNAASVAAWRGRSLAEVLTGLTEARAAWVAWMEELAPEEFFRRRPVGQGDGSPPTWVEVMEKHDLEHAEEIAQWVQEQGLQGGPGPKPVLRLALEAARREWLAAAAMVPVGARRSRPLCGVWTLQDVLGHLADWEQLGAEGLRLMAAGQHPDVEEVADLDAWNQAHVKARGEQSWERVFSDLRSARQAFLAALEALEPSQFDKRYTAPWGGPITPYDWVCVYVEHERGHAYDVREVMQAAAGPAEEPPAKTWTSRG
ncbi:MAG: DinB family protein [Chloroflexia bacterium]|nr:DinB family protein [Chloroflexia bacterium]